MPSNRPSFLAIFKKARKRNDKLYFFGLKLILLIWKMSIITAFPGIKRSVVYPFCFLPFLVLFFCEIDRHIFHHIEFVSIWWPCLVVFRLHGNDAGVSGLLFSDFLWFFFTMFHVFQKGLSTATESAVTLSTVREMMTSQKQREVIFDFPHPLPPESPRQDRFKVLPTPGPKWLDLFLWLRGE